MCDIQKVTNVLEILFKNGKTTKVWFHVPNDLNTPGACNAIAEIIWRCRKPFDQW